MRVTVQPTVDANSDMCVRTRCRTLEELVSLFGRYVEGTSLFIATLGMREQGTESGFTVKLADGTIALRGRCAVLAQWTNSENPFRLPGILLDVHLLTAQSKELFDRMRSNRATRATMRALSSSDGIVVETMDNIVTQPYERSS